MTAADQPPAALEPRRQRLLARIHRSYVTTTQPVRIGGISLVFTRIADPDRVLDQVAAEADLRERLSGKRQPDEHLHLPYWAELWDSAMGIGQFLVRNWGEDAETRRRGDAGPEHDAGTRRYGDAGLEHDAETRRRGDAETTPFPISASPRPRVSESSRITPSPRLPITPSSSLPASPSPRVSASPPAALDLGCGMGLSGTIAAALGAKVLFADIEPPALLFARLNSLPWSSRVRTRKLNWQTDRLAERFDLIIGADILYERAQWEYQEPFLRHHLAPAGTVLLGEPGRQTGDGFIEWIRERGWCLEIFPETVPTREKPVRIFRLQRLAAGMERVS